MQKENKIIADENTAYNTIEEAVSDLKLSRRVKWKNYLGYLCRYTKKSICPEFVVNNGTPVQLNQNNTPNAEN
jgi:hypothetical protein